MQLRRTPSQPKGYEASTGEYEVTAAQGKGKGKKGNAAGDTRFTPCAFFNTERGCLKGENCEYMHAEPKGAKAKGKGKDKGAKGAEAKAKAKPDGKSKAEAKEARAGAKAAAKEAEAKAKAKPDAKAARRNQR